MTIRRKRGMAARLRGDEGIALAAVIGMSVVLMLLITTSLTYSVSSMTKAKNDEEASAAMSAAYAGISDYQARLTNDNTYQKYGDPLAPFSRATGSVTLTLPTGALANPAFGFGTAGSWAPVPGADGNAGFRYEVDNSKYAAKGIIRVRSTGRSGSETRSIVADIRQKGFLDYLYFTDHESRDPAITGKSEALCGKDIYYPERRDADCGTAIQFGAGEVINGPLRSNDALYVCAGATFKGVVETNYNVAPYFRECGQADWQMGKPTYMSKMTMPPTNSSMQNETRTDLPDVPRPGCLYTGPTIITFHGDGYMTVRSPWTKAVNINAAGGVANPACGTPGRGTNNGTTLGSDAGQRIKVPDQNLIYVQAVPGTGDANGWAPSTFPPGITCPANSSGNGLGYPIATDVTTGNTRKIVKETITTTAAGAYYGCRAGDVFVGGSVPKAVKGQVTIASGHYVWVTGDLKYSDPAVDVLGLVGQDAVWVWNPYGTTQTCNNSCPNSSSGTTTTGTLLSDSGREIDAAILSVEHTFQVQNYDQGSPRGALTVVGAIAQRFRGTVGSPPIGYTKNYSYDVRFRSIAPPKFLQAVSTTYGISKFAEVPPAFTATGATR